MEPIDLKQKTDLFVSQDVLQTAKELQTHLATVSYDEQPVVASEAIEVLGDPRELYGGREVYVHALGVRVLYAAENALSFDEQLWHGTYIADSYLKARFSRFTYVRSRAVSSICLGLVETDILRSGSNPEYEGEKIRSGVYVPVHAVETVLVA